MGRDVVITDISVQGLYSGLYSYMLYPQRVWITFSEAASSCEKNMRSGEQRSIGACGGLNVIPNPCSDVSELAMKSNI